MKLMLWRANGTPVSYTVGRQSSYMLAALRICWLKDGDQEVVVTGCLVTLDVTAHRQLLNPESVISAKAAVGSFPDGRRHLIPVLQSL